MQSDISKGLKGRSVYNMFCNNILETKLFQPLIIFSIFSRIKGKYTDIQIHIWGEYNMGCYSPFLRRIGPHWYV